MESRLVLVRHGETEWSVNGRHTGRTDIPLTAKGEQEARSTADTLAEWDFERVFSSPLSRALATARLAGFEPELNDDLLEWNYGDAEGRTNAEIVAERPGWSKWAPRSEGGGVNGGETPDQVGERADRFIAHAGHVEGEVLVFAHGHLLSILIARWLGMDANAGRLFPLATATVSVLGNKRSDGIIETLNHRCGGLLPERPVDR
jgi:probable phosphoglycerate mutase